MSTFYSGALKSKRKSELQDIGRALGLASLANTKEALEEAISKALSDSKKLREDVRFSGLWRPAMGKTPSKHELREKASVRLNQALNAAEVEADRAVAVVQRETREVAKSLESSKAYGVVAKYGRQAKANYAQIASVAQHELSSAWRIIAVSIWLELAYVLLTHTHYHKKYEFGPYAWAPTFITGRHNVTVSLPHYSVWWRAAFLQPFGVWILATVIVPAAVSQLIVFPRPEPVGRRGRRRLDTVAPASPVTFSIIRLAISILLLKTGPLGITSGDWQGLTQFGDFQVLASAVGLAFALYEVIAI